MSYEEYLDFISSTYLDRFNRENHDEILENVIKENPFEIELSDIVLLDSKFGLELNTAELSQDEAKLIFDDITFNLVKVKLYSEFTRSPGSGIF